MINVSDNSPEIYTQVMEQKNDMIRSYKHKNKTAKKANKASIDNGKSITIKLISLYKHIRLPSVM